MAAKNRVLQVFLYFFFTTIFLIIIQYSNWPIRLILIVITVLGFWIYLWRKKVTHNKRNEKVRKRFNFIDIMNGHEFESYLKEILVLNNHHVLLTPKSRDQGADLIVTKDGERIAIQAKRYSHPVGNKAVQEVLGAIHYYDCDSGIVITTSSYTSSAKQLAHKANIKLWSKKEIKELIYGIREK